LAEADQFNVLPPVFEMANVCTAVGVLHPAAEVKARLGGVSDRVGGATTVIDTVTVCGELTALPEIVTVPEYDPGARLTATV
jgi:hypothetical protein